ncbi:hypothetical protein [Bradyrhizobium sp. Ec3.3]|uniref:hypothetical protein n=1 Tax=Bradyrhizobium sp. Ec3.3 TaxID=189753 RepID=UPI0003FC45A6|nr:hypothetical protein [Bradyrhizobium sp. Ec3.3]
MNFSIALPFWREFEATIDQRSRTTDEILKKAEPTTYERFSYIASLWLPSVQESLLDGQYALAAVKLHGFYIFLRAHQSVHNKPGLVESIVDQARALEFVMRFVSSHPEAAKRFDDEHAFINSGSRYAELLLYLAVVPDQFGADEVQSLFTRLDMTAFRAAWAN